jgi:hypothetical protein
MKKNKKTAIFFLLMLIILLIIFILSKYGIQHLIIIFGRIVHMLGAG